MIEKKVVELYTKIVYDLSDREYLLFKNSIGDCEFADEEMANIFKNFLHKISQGRKKYFKE